MPVYIYDTTESSGRPRIFPHSSDEAAQIAGSDKPILLAADRRRLFKRVTPSSDHWYWRGPLVFGHGSPRRWTTPARLLWQLFHGSLPPARHLVRTCGDDRCIAPEHHRPGRVEGTGHV